MIGFYAFLFSAGVIVGVLGCLIVLDWLRILQPKPRITIPRARALSPKVITLGQECLRHVRQTGVFKSGGAK